MAPPAAAEPTRDHTPDASPSVRPGASLDRLLADRGDDGPMLSDLRAPRSLTAEPVENRHVAGQVDTVRTWTYDGLVIEAYEVSGGPTFIQRVAVTGVDYGTASGLAVDEPRAALEAVLGPPVEETGATAVYETGDPAAPTVVEVVYEPDERGQPRAAQITWRPYVD